MKAATKDMIRELERLNIKKDTGRISLLRAILKRRGIIL